MIEIPDKELLAELSSEILKAKQVLVPDLRKFFYMLSCLFKGSDRGIKVNAVQLYKNVFDKVLVTEVEMSWNETYEGVLSMLGEEDA